MAYRTISSGMTFFYKFVFTTCWIALFGAGTLAQWSIGGPDRWAFLAIWAVGGGFILRLCGGFKKVAPGPDSLSVSNYSSEIEIPLTMVEKVTENALVNIRPVTIHLRSATEFGDRIVFMPEVRFFWPWKAHPVVEELRRAAGLD